MNIRVKTNKNTSGHGLVNYIAHSKLDKEREGEKRDLFSDHKNGLDVRQSNREISVTELKPKSEELMHIVLAPQKEEFDRLGKSPQERAENFKMVVAATLDKLRGELKAKSLKWIAAVHLNTDDAHAHVAIQKQYTDETGKIKRFTKVPHKLLYHYEKNANGEYKRDAEGKKILIKGALISAAEDKIAEIARRIEQNRDLKQVADKTRTEHKTIEAEPSHERDEIERQNSPANIKIEIDLPTPEKHAQQELSPHRSQPRIAEKTLANPDRENSAHAAQNQRQNRDREKLLATTKTAVPEKSFAATLAESKKQVPENRFETRETGADPLTVTPAYHNRRVLAEEMLLAAEIERRRANIENLLEHGDKKRFEIKDEATGRTRHVSLFDIERRIATRSRRKAQAAHPDNPEKRDKLFKLLEDHERAQNSGTIKRLEKVREHIIGYERRHLADAEQKHVRVSNQALLIKKGYERAGKPEPLPVFRPDEIQKLQSEAIRQKDLEKTRYLERVRHNNAREREKLRAQTAAPIRTRRDRDVREFVAQKIISELKIRAAELRLENYAQNREFNRAETNGKLWSHQELRRHERQTETQNTLWNKIKNGAARVFGENAKPAAKLDYQKLHDALDEKLGEIQNDKQSEIEAGKTFNQTLAEIYRYDTNPRKNELAPKFNRFELAEVEDLALAAGDRKMYESIIELQAEWLVEQTRGNGEKLVSTDKQPNERKQVRKKNQNRNEKSVPTLTPEQAERRQQEICARFILGRAAARQIIAETRLAEAIDKKAAAERNRDWIKHKIVEPATGAEKEVSLREAARKKHYSLVETLLEAAFESSERREQRRAVEKAVAIKDRELKNAVDEARADLQRIAAKKIELQKTHQSAELVEPIFTPKEIAALEQRVNKTIDKNEAARLERTIERAEKHDCVQRLQDALASAGKALSAAAAVVHQQSIENQKSKSESAVRSAQQKEMNFEPVAVRGANAKVAEQSRNERGGDTKFDAPNRIATIKQNGETQNKSNNAQTGQANCSEERGQRGQHYSQTLERER